jgi:hypothetical protein
MKSSKFILGSAGLLALATAIFGIVQFRIAGEANVELRAVKARQEQASAAIARLDARLRAESERAKATEGDNATLAAALEKARVAKVAASTAAPVRLTQEAVRARYDRARELAKGGDPAEALKELLWCFDEGMAGNSSYTGVRLSAVLSAIKELGQRYPAALAALRERRDRAQQRILAGEGDGGEIPDLTALNRVLGDNQLTLAVFDQLPVGDRRRRSMAIFASETLIENRRYNDVLAARSYATMSSSFEMETQDRAQPANAANSEQLRNARRSYAVTSTVKSIEVLAGAGDLEHARALATRLLNYDGSDETKAALQTRLVRAGHPDLLDQPATSPVSP